MMKITSVHQMLNELDAMCEIRGASLLCLNVNYKL